MGHMKGVEGDTRSTSNQNQITRNNLMNINKVLFTGNPTGAPELLKAGSTHVVNITLANNERYTDEQGNEHEITTYADVKIWGKAAQSFAKLVSTKSEIYVEGQLRTEKWETPEGGKRSKLVIKADRWQFTQYPKKVEDQQPVAEDNAKITETKEDKKGGKTK
jgi:single-strand DNA-binding protein